MDASTHLMGMGKIQGNLHSLEVLLRFFMCRLEGVASEIPTAGVLLVPETPMTDYRSLGKLIATFNSSLTQSDQRYRLSDDIVGVRDALAHGRLMSLATHFPLTLYKFGKPVAAGVPVEASVSLDEAWFEQKRGLIADAINSVMACGRDRWSDWLG